MKDQIYTNYEYKHPDLTNSNEELKDFAFNSKVASVFDDMVTRSVPGYDQVQEFTEEFVTSNIPKPHSIYDLGCSTGTTLIKLARRFINHSEIIKENKAFPKFIGIDSSVHMISRCKEKIEALGLESLVSLRTQSIEETDLENASLVISHYTLQFLKPESRQNIIKKIYQNLNEHGYFIFSEKIKFSDTKVHEFMTKKYYEYKKANGYSEVEISRKREALENVLVPLTLEENVQLLKNAGFSEISLISSNLLFVSILAKK
jgi:tRNA (cmo5U34)-methyltransferase